MEYEKKECWAVVWSDTDPLSFAVMEKSRLHIVRGVTADDPITTDAYICQFSDLKVKTVLLDDIMQSENAQLKASEVIIDQESKQIQEIREMMKK